MFYFRGPVLIFGCQRVIFSSTRNLVRTSETKVEFKFKKIRRYCTVMLNPLDQNAINNIESNNENVGKLPHQFDFYKPPKYADNAEVRLCKQIEYKYGQKFANYEEWWRWTCDNYPQFWESILKEYGVKLSSPYNKIVEEDVPFNKVPRWFIGAKLNYAENCLKNGRDDQIAFIQAKSPTELIYYDFKRLKLDVENLATVFRRHFQIQPGDRVCAYMPNCYETSVAMLASASIGAVWASASVDFGPDGVLDRFSQISPKLLFIVDSTIYKGKKHSLKGNINEIINGLPSLKNVILIPEKRLNDQHANMSIKDYGFENVEKIKLWKDLLRNSERPENSYCQSSLDFQYEQVPFDHPLFILFSSGTTGTPKAMVHTVGGTLLKHIEEHIVQMDTNPSDRVFFYTTCGWMMWNWVMSVIYTGASIVLFDESPLEPDPDVLMRITQNANVTVLGMGAKVYDEYAKMDRDFGSNFNLEHLRLILSTASPLKPSTFEFINSRVKPGVLIGSISGGTDIVGCFMGATLNRPVVSGECQHFMLGMDACAVNEKGEEVFDERGELVCRKPFPSMPSYFINDPEGKRYHKAYFSKFPNLWTHGDFCLVNSKTNGIQVFGRSDTTLNRGGVRIGTAEIYNVIEGFKQISDSVIVGRIDPDDLNNEHILLFVVMQSDEPLTEEFQQLIKSTLRRRISPRHVPNEIHPIKGIPYTSSGKKVELAVKQIINGEKVENTSALRNPEALEYFLPFCFSKY